MADILDDTPAAAPTQQDDGGDSPLPATIASGPGTPAPPQIAVSPEEQASVKNTGWAGTHPNPAVPATPPSPQRSAGWGQKLSDMWNNVKSGTNKLATSVNHIPGDVINNASNLAVGVVGGAMREVDKGVAAVAGKSAMPAFDAAWDSGDVKDINPFQISEGTQDKLFGKKPGGLYDAAEAVGTFAASAYLGGEAAGVSDMAPGTAKTLAHMGLNGLVQAATVDPRAARISDMVENGPPELSTPITRFLKSNGTDSEALARIKNGMEGVITGAAIDTFIGGLKAVASTIRGGGADAAASVSAADVPPSAPSPYTVKPLDNGTFAVQGPEAPAMRTLYRVEPAVNPGTTPEAEAAAKEALGPDYYQQTQDEKGRLFSDAPREEYGHGSPDHTTYSVQVPESDVESYGREHGTLGKEYLLPQEIADTKTPMAANTPIYSAATELPTSSSAADAESHAAALNEAYNTIGIPTGHIDDTHVAALTDAINTAQKGDGLGGLKLPTDAFNYNYFGGTKETQATVQALADQFSDAFTGAKGRVGEGAGTSTEDFVAKATDLVRTTNANSWLADAKNTANMQGTIDAQQFARKIILKQLAGKVATLSRALDTNPTNALAGANLKAAAEQMLQLGAETAGIDSGFGRSLQRLKNVIPDLQAGEEAGNSAANIAGEAHAPNFTDNFTPKDWQDLARQVRLSGGDASLIQDAMYGSVAKKAAETAGDTGAIEKINAFRANMMLSGPKTQFKLAASQALSSLWSTGEYWLGGNITRAIGILKGNSAATAQGVQDAQFGKDALYGLTQNFSAAWRAASRSLTQGGGVLDPALSIAADEGQTEESSIANGAMRAVNIPTSITQANHEFFKNVDYLSSIRALSMRASREDIAQMGPMSAEEENQFIAGRLADDLRMSTNPTTGKALNPVALQMSQDATFSSPLTGFAKTIQDGVQKYPLLRFIAPFVRTPIDLARYSWQRTPLLGLASRQMQADLTAGGLRRSVALGKQASGAMLWGTVASWASAGNMVGEGPSDKVLRQQWLDAGHMPYSVRVPGTNEWLSYKGIDQLSKVMSLVSDMTEMSGETHEAVSSDIAAKFMVAASKDVTNQSFMQGVSQFSDAFDSGDPNKFKALFGGIATSFLPAASRQIDTPDGYTEVRGLMDQLKSSIPHLSSTLEPRRNILGEKVIKPPGNLLQQMNPFTLAPGADINNVQEQLVELGKGISMPATKVGGVDLTDRSTWKRNAQDTQSPYDRMLELQGNPGEGKPSLRAALTTLMESPGWAKMGAGTDQYPGGERHDAAASIIKAYQGIAFAKVQKEYPGLLEAVQGGRIQSKRALAAPLGSRTGSASRSPAFIQ